MLFLVTESTVRFYLDYDTPVGNCSEFVPVFGGVVGKAGVGCFCWYDMVVLRRSYESVKFFDVNNIIWFPVRRLTRVKK